VATIDPVQNPPNLTNNPPIDPVQNPPNLTNNPPIDPVQTPPNFTNNPSICTNKFRPIDLLVVGWGRFWAIVDIAI
jgi:hypothetical protein